MLEELSITNLAIIDRLDVRFDPGFNVLTGETGAGKSIIIDAVGAVLGGRVGGDLVRSGAPSARVEGIFTLDGDDGALGDLLREHDLLDDDEGEGEGALILRREINANGRTTARINGRAVPVSVLGRIGELLVDIHGQSEHLSLFRVDEHVELLDRYAANGPLRAEVAALVAEVRRVERERRSLQEAQADAARRLDLLQYQVDEIGKAELRPDEEDELLTEKRVLGNAERLAALAVGASDLLNGAEDGARGALDLLNEASAALDDLTRVDESQKGSLEALNGALYTLEEVARDLRSYASSIEADPARLAVIEERLDLLQRLKRKYGETIADVIAFGEAAAREQEGLINSEERLEELADEIERLKARIGEKASALSRRRQEAALRLATGVEGELQDLNMARARFVVDITHRPDPDGAPVTIDGEEGRYAYDERGIDRVEFLISPNPGEDLKPLARIASGGEASRLMLALKTMLSAVDRTPTLIFDEVDTGVGGRSGAVVGEKLRLLGETHQVLCITHLPQVAALGAEHLRIVKRVDDGRTRTEVEPLEGRARIEELAAMLGGFPPPPTALKTAEELLARKTKPVASSR